MLARRELNAALVGAIGTYGLIDAIAGAAAWARATSRGGRRWIEAQQQIAAELRAGRMQPRKWQEEVEALAAEVDLAELLQLTDFAALKASMDFSDGQPSKRFVNFKDAGRLDYAIALFGFRRGQVITPHGHRNMVSAHLVAEGAFRVRTFDRIGDEPGAIIVKPSLDGRLEPGAVSTMSSQRDNIHWFVAERDECSTIDVIVDALEPGRDRYVIELVDPLGGERRGDGTIRAPIITWDESVAKYA